MRITREMVLEKNPTTLDHKSLWEIESNTYIAYLASTYGDPYIVWKFHEAPEELRKICNFNGGDEDWLVITEKEPEFLPFWIENISPDFDTYDLNGLVIYVGSHS
jgi:hypothetical protein